MNDKPFLPCLNELVRCYQAFEAYSTAHIRTLDLTAPQFDIIATLGNTAGMTPKELGEQTLITKGTLTGIIDRLEAKDLVRRTAHSSDGRSQIVQLTESGNALFEAIFPEHMAHLHKAFAGFSKQDFKHIETALARLREAFVSAGSPG
jgi:MarR family transcriptional regulator, 2-MHQ and catechol-resistance regulon repressor